jgi:hypothetical protein
MELMSVQQSSGPKANSENPYTPLHQYAIRECNFSNYMSAIAVKNFTRCQAINLAKTSRPLWRKLMEFY